MHFHHKFPMTMSLQPSLLQIYIIKRVVNINHILCLCTEWCHLWLSWKVKRWSIDFFGSSFNRFHQEIADSLYVFVVRLTNPSLFMINLLSAKFNILVPSKLKHPTCWFRWQLIIFSTFLYNCLLSLRWIMLPMNIHVIAIDCFCYDFNFFSFARLAFISWAFSYLFVLWCNKIILVSIVYICYYIYL